MMRGYYKSSKSVIRAKLEEKDKLFDNGDHYRGGWAQGGVRTNLHHITSTYHHSLRDLDGTDGRTAASTRASGRCAQPRV